ncbi:MAG: class I SAM-dependent methyltransferase [Planctomycetaceae bacterium]
MGLVKILKNRLNLFMGIAGGNPLMAAVLNTTDIGPKLRFPEFRELPPNALRVRVGVGGRLFNNQPQFLLKGRDLWLYLLANGLVRFTDNIVEIGSGIGRRTYWMRDFEFHGIRYSGKYTGIDIDPEMVDWCNSHYDRERFEFHCASHASSAYLSKQETARYRLPVDDASQGLVFGTSVLTHLLEEQMINYFEEAFRVLVPGRALVMTCKCVDLTSDDRGNTYKHRSGNAYIENPGVPEAAVAYESKFVEQTLRNAGFGSVDFHHNDSNIQHTFVALKPS